VVLGTLAALLILGSLTGPLVNLATHVIRSLGLAGVAVLNATTGVIGMPGTEPTMLFAGFNVYQGHLTLIGIFVFGLVGDMLGASVAYSIGFFGTRELIDRQGSKLHVSQKRVDRAHGWFDRHGDPVIVVSRLIPFARAGFPYAAGVARMPFWRFALLATLGSIPWIIGLGLLGREVGSNWSQWRHHLEYADYTVIALVVLAIAYLILRRVRTNRRRATADAVPK
jgi:membrane protein DedA with SNARE-associated domain